MKKIMSNVVDQKILDGNREVEDVTSITLPDIEHVTTELDVAGMSGKLNIPDPTRLEAMEISIAHNNGVNSKVLNEPRVHKFEFRLALQMMNVSKGEIEYKSMKYRVHAAFTKVSKGEAKTGNPLGATNSYSVYRYEEEQDGVVITLIDLLNNIIRINGQDYNNVIKKMLN
jgi:P2 family phage contractile tail tube protein